MPRPRHARALNLDQRAALPNDAGMDNKKPRRAVVIGAGIVGMSTA
ncbi:MAG: pyruvate/2-oxoglutarate dehydrogenase complex dihydrolipoamide dehydrogenase (E3) component, partial [Gammaproteobacteria bacterium]